MKYFGAPWNPNIATLEQTPTPVGQPCSWCGEAIAAGDQGFVIPTLGLEERPAHLECFLRQLYGSVARASAATRKIRRE